MSFLKRLLSKRFLIPSVVAIVVIGIDTKNPQLLLTNLSPDEWLSTDKDKVSINGIATDEGDIKEVTWKTKDGETGSANISGGEWSIQNIPLTPGDNQITITATDNAGNTSTSVVNVVYNVDILFSDLTLSQDFIFKNDPATSITARSLVETTAAKGIGKVHLYKVNSRQKEKLTEMLDNGVVANGDDIPSDSQYSGIEPFSSSSNTTIELRVGTTIGTGTKVFYSGVMKLKVIDKPTQNQMSDIFKLNEEFSKKFDDMKKGSGDKDAAKKLADELNGRTEIAIAGVSESGFGVWWKYKNSGVLAGINNNPDGTRGEKEDEAESKREKSRVREAQAAPEEGAVQGITESLAATVNFGINAAHAAETKKKKEVKSTKAIYLGPYLSQFAETDDYHKAWKVIKESKCPKCQTVEKKNKAVKVEDFKTLSNYGLVMIPSHGDTWFNGKFADECATVGDCPAILANGGGFVITWTDQQIGASDLLKYWSDLVNYRLAIDATDGTLAVMPPYITAYNGTFPDSLVYLGTCRSTHNLSMAAAYLAKGAKGYLGFSEYVDSEYAGDVTNEFFKSFMNKGKSATESFSDAVAAEGADDKGNTPAFFNYVGQGDLKMGGKDLQNAGFEDGLVGWQTEGDSRVINRLAALKPPEGKRMAIISTGLGSVNNSNSALVQNICSQEGKLTISFKYNVVSEEPLEYVGSVYDDNFKMTVTINGSPTRLVTRTINNSSWKKIGGINFAGGDATTYHTGWKTVTKDLGNIKADDVVKIEFRVNDKGDSIYDTAALIDDVKMVVK